MKFGLSYGDVCMVPKYNNIASRTIPSLETFLTKDMAMDIPIVAANMDTVIGKELAAVLVEKGSVPIFHRFYKDPAELIDLVKKYSANSFMSCGVTELDGSFELIECNALKPRGVCVDIAHGHSAKAFATIHCIKEKFGDDFQVIAGNVCTPTAFRDLVHAGADAVKVGIGPGSVCTTRRVTAFGVPQFTAVQECGEVARDLKVPMIADGGIRGSREIILALAAGASSVMIGGLFAETFEAAGKGRFRGQASEAFQNDYFGKLKDGTVPEGVSRVVKQHVAAGIMIDDLLAGVRSGMTYCGASSIHELQRKAEFVQITNNYWD